MQCLDIAIPLKLTLVDYRMLNARQQENYSYYKVSAVLAECGFSTMRVSDDWQGADFIAQHIDGETFLKVQLKGRLSSIRSTKTNTYTSRSSAILTGTCPT